LAALLHDASEAYFADIARPTKITLPEVLALEERIQNVIEQRFQLPKGILNHAEIKASDTIAIFIEGVSLITDFGHDENVILSKKYFKTNFINDLDLYIKYRHCDPRFACEEPTRSNIKETFSMELLAHL
jgi:hypothetical protein